MRKSTLIYLIIIAAVTTRLVPHMPNLGLITALAIFSAAYLPGRQAVAITFGARLLSDIFLGFFSWPVMVAVYLSHGAGLLLGWWIKRTPEQHHNQRWLKIASSGLVTTLVFFLATNFAFLYEWYPHTWQGVILSYANALPFVRGTLMGDIGFTVALFGSYGLVQLWQRHQAKLYARA